MSAALSLGCMSDSFTQDIESDKEDGEAYYNDGVDNQLEEAVRLMNEKLEAADGQEEADGTAA